MHSVTLTPTVVDLDPGGSPVAQLVTITGVPADTPPTVAANQLTVAVGGEQVMVSTTVNVTGVDNPEPVVILEDGVNFTVAADTPVQDAFDPTVWTVSLTYQA